MDAFHGSLVPGFEVSLTVLTTAMARHGDTVIFDAGRKSVGIDFVSPPIQGHDYEARYYAEEHALFDTGPEFTAEVSDRVRLICGYAPTTVNLHDVLFAVSRRPRRGRVAGFPARTTALRLSGGFWWPVIRFDALTSCQTRTRSPYSVSK